MAERSEPDRGEHRWYARPVLFVKLTTVALDDFRRELVERSVPGTNSWWGCDVIRIEDPDGNELLFPTPD